MMRVKNGAMKSSPFQVAYAISIHKAQGPEYNSVKVIVTNEIEELIFNYSSALYQTRYDYFKMVGTLL